jgi:hypothetical protein
MASLALLSSLSRRMMVINHDEGVFPLLSILQNGKDQSLSR